MASTRLPRFDKYHTGKWPYPLDEGVGLALTGVPTDVHAFIDALQTAGCSPVATRRILAELEAGRQKFTTVRSHLDFNGIGDALTAAGVTMTIVPPAEAQDPRYDHAAFALLQGWPIKETEFTAEELQLIEQRHQHTQASLARIPYGFGKFD